MKGKKLSFEANNNITRYLTLVAFGVVELIVFCLLGNNFASLVTVGNVIRQSASLFICAIGMTMIILTGGIDLSPGATIALSGTVAAFAMQAIGTNSFSEAMIGILVAILIACLIGAINGTMISYASLSPFIVTLATQYMARGMRNYITGAGRVSVTNDVFNYLGSKYLFTIGNLKIPSSLILIIIIYAITIVILKRTTFGRYTYAVGGNIQTARASGVNDNRHLIEIYTLAGVFFALGAVIMVGRSGTAEHTAGVDYEFDIITAVVVGGTLLSGGVGTLTGTLLGVIDLGIMTTGLGMMTAMVSTYWQYVIKGGLIFMTVILNLHSQEIMAALKKKKTSTTSEPMRADNSKALEYIQRNQQCVLKFEHIDKIFPGVKALDDISIEVKRGKVHALVGENGAGKSTLIKILSGVYSKEAGSIKVDDIPVEMHSPVDSTKLGISVIYQELLNVPELTVAQNIFMGKELMRNRFFKNNKAMNQRAKELLDKFGLNIDVTRRINDYSVGQLQMIEIAKAVDSNAWIVVMDEPTAAITEADKDKLFDIIRDLKQRNIAIIYVSHRLSEIFEIADEVTVLRDGKHVITKNIGEVDESSIIKSMVGHELNDIFTRTKTASDENPVVLEVKNLYRKGGFGPVSFKVNRGELLGFSGLIGAGRTEIMRCIVGLDRPDGGEIYLGDQKVDLHNPYQATQAGICYVSEDRRREGIIPLMTVRENISLPSLPWISKLGFVDTKADIGISDKFIDIMRIKVSSMEQKLGTLSGGNQQKCCLAKWLARNPKVLILDEPTRGIDVGAKAEIHKLVDSLTKKGIAVIMISSELPEIIGASDRIIVMYEGHITGEFSQKTEDVTQEKLMTCAAGIGIELEQMKA
ncbi:MAG: ATP-binding cassette domain-containing protein [Flexilinea sp.]